ncbi:hypothetical protein PAXINDRAFT_75911 [Paxillus involutus ATCC 200175]|uniref:HAT C-terminal dimerisation domain-containing protein n=2 Tax=Paxillus involutus ATCC 200175 TaxID=664439 RepID=A0A0C9SMG4_PAXIN|nr:hypothetical protein PAXINDRAFT_92471 [Paxillus involutus ATCC 200175]KIJ16016.1 hypothetical protein PAXINDRAFT_75911 [Paxillus involutus ATCC 200175]
MALDFCSAPASSTDAERSFSDGRRQVNFMQHNTSSQTFKSEMAIGSWEGTPLFPDVRRAVDIIEAKGRRS